MMYVILVDMKAEASERSDVIACIHESEAIDFLALVHGYDIGAE